ncbi:MAG: Sec-independent protein translocase subunit TatA/TatB [Actinomycetota bacterium]
MPQIGPLEILMVGVLALLVFGPDKLPGMLRGAGRALGEFRRISASVKQEFKEGLLDDEAPATTTMPAAAPAEASDG